ERDRESRILRFARERAPLGASPAAGLQTLECEQTRGLWTRSQPETQRDASRRGHCDATKHERNAVGGRPEASLRYFGVTSVVRVASERLAQRTKAHIIARTVTLSTSLGVVNPAAIFARPSSRKSLIPEVTA